MRFFYIGKVTKSYPTWVLFILPKKNHRFPFYDDLSLQKEGLTRNDEREVFFSAKSTSEPS